MRRQFFLSTLLATCLITLSQSALSETQKAEFFGGIETEYPAWFKESFLDLREDLTEAKEAGKRLVIFFHQDGCPYCNALVERNFAQKDIAEKARKNFDIITINMWGDRPVTYVDGVHYTEKTFAEKLKVQFTPTVIFFDEQGKVALRINGYHSPQRFNLDLDYVAHRKEKEMSYRDFMRANWPASKTNKNLNPEPYFSKPPYDFSAKVGIKGKPFVVFFEQKDCPNCDALHKKILPDTELLGVLKQFDAVQLDMWSKTPVVTPEGKKMTAREWAKQLDVKYAPSIVVFNTEGKEVIRSEAFFKVFHTQGVLNYVLSEGYREQPSFQRYLTDYADHFREQGKAVDIWRYANEEVGEKKH
jgi:thioredoxin-related protein